MADKPQPFPPRPPDPAEAPRARAGQPFDDVARARIALHRLSLQRFDEHGLDVLGRIHRRCIELAQTVVPEDCETTDVDESHQVQAGEETSDTGDRALQGEISTGI